MALTIVPGYIDKRPVAHYGAKIRAYIHQDSSTFSTTASGVQEIYNKSVSENDILFVTDLCIYSSTTVTFGAGFWDGTTQFDKLKTTISAGETFIKSFVTPIKISGSANSAFRVWANFPTGGGTMVTNITGWVEKVLPFPGYYDTDCYNERIYS